MNAAVYLVIGAMLLLGGKWETPAIFQRKPPTKELAAAQDQLAAARAGQAAAEAKLAAAEAARQQQVTAQLDYTQQMVAGTDLALGKIPADQRSPEVKLAAEFSARAVAGFEAARGKLSAEQMAEIHRLFDNALAAKDAEVATLKNSLKQKDTDLQAASSAKAALEKQIPVLEASVTVAKAETEVVSAKVQTKTAEVASYADKVADERAKNGTLDAYAGHLVRILIGLGILYGLIHFALPSLAQEFPAVSWLDKANKAAKSISSAHL